MIGLLILISGGGSLFAVVRGKYNVLAEKVDTGIKTEFVVYSRSDTEAKEEVSLNGWRVLSVKKIADDYHNENVLSIIKNDDKLTSNKLDDKVNSGVKNSKKTVKPSKKSNKTSKKVLTYAKKTKNLSYCDQINISICGDSSKNINDKFTDLKVVLSEKLSIPEEKINITFKKVKK